MPDADALAPSNGVDDSDPTLDDVLADLEELEETAPTPERRRQIREVMKTVRRVETPAVFGRTIVGFDRADAGEALLGAMLFGIPMFVEGGTQEVGAHIATHPLSLVATHLLAVGLIVGILYVAEFQDVRVHNPILGFVPRRLVGVLSISFVTALLVMTWWGRVTWTTPWLAFAQTTAAYVPMALGAALGDILPGS